MRGAPHPPSNQAEHPICSLEQICRIDFSNRAGQMRHSLLALSAPMVAPEPKSVHVSGATLQVICATWRLRAPRAVLVRALYYLDRSEAHAMRGVDSESQTALKALFVRAGLLGGSCLIGFWTSGTSARLTLPR